MNLVILTPEKEVFRGEITSVKVPGTSGQFEILSNHAAIVSSLTEGEVRILDAAGKKLQYNISRGFVEVINNEVSLLVRGLTEVA
ncbi:MAG: F-type H+-transporting ATPase subunit epsilon [Saprospiraceae bacterium]|jgi:F-type H+-transporting ATPase subunit epsilon